MLRFIVPLAIAVTVFVFVRTRRNSPTTSAAKPVAPIGSVEADRQTLHALREAGADLTKPTEVNFYIYFSERAAAESASAQATTPTLRASVKRAADDSAWLCLVSGTMVLSESAIRHESTRLQAVAAAHGGDYDGWEAAVAK